MNPLATKGFTYAEINLIEMPVNNYTLKKHGEYAVFVPNELIDSYEEFLPLEIQ